MQFVWFLGTSAVGKQKTIDRCLLDHQWAADTFHIDISNGLMQFQSGESPPLDFHGCSLMKWQHRTDNHIRELQLKHPDDEHIVIMLRRETEEHLKGYREKFLDLFKADPAMVAVLKDDCAAREKFVTHRTTDENTSRAHRGNVSRFMEFFIENDVFTFVGE